MVNMVAAALPPHSLLNPKPPPPLPTGQSKVGVAGKLGKVGKWESVTLDNWRQWQISLARGRCAICIMSLWQRCVATVSIRNVLFMTTLRFQSGYVGNKAPKTRAPNENVTRWAHALWHLLALWRMRVARGESHPAHTHISKVSPCLPRIKSIFTLNQKGKGGKSPKETLSLQLVSFVFHFSLAAFFIFIFFFFLSFECQVAGNEHRNVLRPRNFYWMPAGFIDVV